MNTRFGCTGLVRASSWTPRESGERGGGDGRKGAPRRRARHTPQKRFTISGKAGQQSKNARGTGDTGPAWAIPTGRATTGVNIFFGWFPWGKARWLPAAGGVARANARPTQLSAGMWMVEIKRGEKRAPTARVGGPPKPRPCRRLLAGKSVGMFQKGVVKKPGVWCWGA